MKIPKTHSPKKPIPKMWVEKEPSVKRKSLNNEERLSEDLDFKLTPGSGNKSHPTHKGDGQTKRFVYELKETEKDSLTLSYKVLSKLYREASIIGKDPVLVMSLYGLPSPLPKDWVVIPIDVFNKLKV